MEGDSDCGVVLTTLIDRPTQSKQLLTFAKFGNVFITRNPDACAVDVLMGLRPALFAACRCLHLGVVVDRGDGRLPLMPTELVFGKCHFVLFPIIFTKRCGFSEVDSLCNVYHKL